MRWMWMGWILWAMVGTGLAGATDTRILWQERGDRGRPVFLYFSSEKCPACRRMEATTLSRGGVVSTLNADFCSVQPRGKRRGELARKYGVFGYPASVFLEPGGEKILTLPGYQSPAVFAVYLEYIRSRAYEEQSVWEYYASEFE